MDASEEFRPEDLTCPPRHVTHVVGHLKRWIGRRTTQKLDTSLLEQTVQMLEEYRELCDLLRHPRRG